MTMLLLLALNLGAGSPSVAWVASLDTALERARADAKLVLVQFAAPDRPLSQTMQTETLEDARVVELVNAQFVNVRLSLPADAQHFDALVGGRGALATCILDGTGDVVASLAGYADAATFTRFAQQALKGATSLQQARTAAANAPDDARTLLSLAVAYESLDSTKRAVETLQSIVAREPAAQPWVALAHERLARHCALKGKNRDARSHLARYREQDTEATRERRDNAVLTEVLVCGIEMKYDDAARLLADLFTHYPDSDEIDQSHFVAAVIAHEAGDDQRSRRELTVVIEQFPQSRWRGAAERQIEHNKQSPAGTHRH